MKTPNEREVQQFAFNISFERGSQFLWQLIQNAPENEILETMRERKSWRDIKKVTFLTGRKKKFK